MHRLTRLVVLMVATAAAGVLAAPVAPPSNEQIQKWVRQLGDNDFNTREDASRKLWEAGQAAEAALVAAAKSDDAEVSRRAKDVLEKFRWGVYPDTPQKVVDLISKYQETAAGERGAVIRELFEAGGPGCRVLAKILQREEDANARRDLVTQVNAEMGRALPQLLADGNFAALEPILEMGIAGEVKPGASNYTAYWALRGKLDERIAHHKALAAKATDPKPHLEVLAYLLRAKGESAAAREAARKAEKPELEEELLYEAGDWKKLAKRRPTFDTEEKVDKLGFHAAFHRLAGDSKQFEEAVAELKKLADGAPADDPRLFAVAKALFINDRPADALAVLSKGPHRLKSLEVLCAQLKFRDAMALVDRAREANSDELPVLELTLARHLYGLGEKEKAKEVFARYAGQIQAGKDVAWYETLIDAESRAGLKDDAFDHAAKILSVTNDQGWPTRLFLKLYAEKAAVSADAWWSFLRKRQATRESAAVMKEVRGLLAGTLPTRDVTERVNAWVESLERRMKANRSAVPLNELDRAGAAIADAAEAAGLGALAAASLEKLDSAGALLRVGDLLAAKKKWPEAADRYRRAWEKDRHQALALFLYGHALVKAGDKDAGSKRMDQAHWLPLGEEATRLALGTELGQRGYTEAYKRETDLLLRLSQPASYYWGEALRRTAGDALARKEYLVAAEAHERAMLRVLRSYVNFVQAGAYVAVPALVHRQRAAGLAVAGRLDDARREVALAQAALPGDVDLATRLVPELDKRDRKKDADEVFARVLAVYDTLCKDFPRCSWTHNSVAWLSACCHRNLDAALEHAKKAVELAPESAGHLDTLAEVYFQRGDKDKAIATQKRVVQMDPKKPYYRKQLKRIESGDPQAERPSEEEDDD